MKYYLGVLAVTCAVTYLIRMLPLTLFRKEIKTQFLKDFFFYIPYAVLGAMTFPAILYSTRSVASAAVGFIAACVSAYFRRGLLTTAIISAVCVYITELIVL